jgi:hypothetical protein
MTTDDHPSPSSRRRRPLSRRRVSDSVIIGDDDGHAWWAGRDDLDHVVTPKTRGAAARARRAAVDAFAPAGTTAPTVGPTDTSDSPASPRWAPEDLFTWADASASTPPAPPERSVANTPWDVLGLTSSSPWDEVTRRHRQLALRHHPDRVGAENPAARADAELTMSEINAAFSELRRIYQLSGDI